MTPPLIAWPCSIAAVASIAAAITDARTGRIPNWLTLPTIAIAIAVHGTFQGLSGTVTAVLGLLLGAAVPAILYKTSQGRAIGGGDVKLFAALGALLGPTRAIEAEFGAFALLCVFALIRLAFQGQLLRMFVNAAMILLNPLLPRKRRRMIQPEALTEMRMGPAIATAVLSTIAVEHLGKAWPWLP